MFVVALPLVSNQTVRTGAQAPTRATTVPKDSAAVQPQPTAIAVAVTTLNLSFSVKSVVCASEPSRQIIKLVVTAQGGVSPYDYYNATASLGRAVAGGAPLEVSAPFGEPVPFNLAVVDKIGQRASSEFLWRSSIQCSW